MASISHDRKTGRRIIQFVGTDGKRRSVRLGKVSKRQAESAKRFIEDLTACQVAGTSPKNATAEWLANLPDTIRRRIERAGLAEPQKRLECPTLAEWLNRYIAGRSDVKPSTRTVLSHTRRNLIEYFGPDRPIREISPGDADEWRQHLIREGLADNTVRRRCGIAKQFFRAARRKRLIAENPFDDLRSTLQANASRDYFVSREDAQKVLDACPDAQWRLLFALSRFTGLRCPSEHLALRWSDVDWAQGRFTVTSPKTAYHAGHGSRQVPLFPDLVPYLREVFEQADPGTEYVVTRYRQANQNLRTHLCRIIRNAGLEPWPKLFQNLRSTCETELAERFPLHVVCAWLGNSRPVAMKHYLQVTDDHWRQAVQNPVQSVSATTCQGVPEAPGRERGPAVVTSGQQVAGVGNDISREVVGVTGLEPVTSSL